MERCLRFGALLLIRSVQSDDNAAAEALGPKQYLCNLLLMESSAGGPVYFKSQAQNKERFQSPRP